MRLSLDTNGMVSIEGKFSENNKIEKSIKILAEKLCADVVTCLELDEDDNVSDWSLVYDMQFISRGNVKEAWKDTKKAL